MMYAVQKAGGKVEYTQISEWLGYLIANGYFELDCEGEGGDVKFILQLTKKGETYLCNKKIGESSQV